MLSIANILYIAWARDKLNTIEKHWGNNTDLGEPKYSEKRLSQCQILQDKFYTGCPGFETGPLRSQPCVFFACLSVRYAVPGLSWPPVCI
jgi:hypothetical protein